MYIELLHEMSAMSIDAVGTYAKQACYILGRFQFSDKLQ